MQGLLNNGDEILVPSPDYPLWTASVTLAGGTAVHYICDEQSDWYPDIDDMRSKITPNTKGIVVINPNNPTGALYPKEILEQTIEADREYIRCQRCECNMLSAIHNQSVVDLICKQDQVEFSCKINDLFQNLLWI